MCKFSRESKRVRRVDAPESKGRAIGVQLNNRKRTRLLIAARAAESVVEFMTLHELAHVQRRNRQLHEAGLSADVMRVRRDEVSTIVTKKMAEDPSYRKKAEELFASRNEDSFPERCTA